MDAEGNNNCTANPNLLKKYRSQSLKVDLEEMDDVLQSMDEFQ